MSVAKPACMLQRIDLCLGGIAKHDKPAYRGVTRSTHSVSINQKIQKYFVRNDLFISVYKECVLVHQDHHLHEDMNALKYASQFAII